MGLVGVSCNKGVDVDRIKDCLVKVVNCGVKPVKCSVTVIRLPHRKLSGWEVRKLKPGVREMQVTSTYSCSITYSTRMSPVVARTKEKWLYERHSLLSTEITQENHVTSTSDVKKFASLGTLQRLKLIQRKSFASSLKRKIASRAAQAFQTQLNPTSSMIKMRVEYLKTKENIKNLTVFAVPRKVAVKFVITASSNCVRDVGRALISREGLHYPQVDEVDLVKYDMEFENNRINYNENFSDVSDEFYKEDATKDPDPVSVQVWMTRI